MSKDFSEPEIMVLMFSAVVAVVGFFVAGTAGVDYLSHQYPIAGSVETAKELYGGTGFTVLGLGVAASVIAFNKYRREEGWFQ